MGRRRRLDWAGRIKAWDKKVGQAWGDGKQWHDLSHEGTSGTSQSQAVALGSLDLHRSCLMPTTGVLPANAGPSVRPVNPSCS